MKHIVSTDNGRNLKKLVQKGINEETNQIDFSLIRPVPEQISNALVDNKLANAAIGMYVINLGFNHDEIPSPVLALMTDLKENSDDFFEQVGPKRRGYLATFQSAATAIEEPLDDEVIKRILNGLRQELDTVKAYVMSANVDLSVFSGENHEIVDSHVSDVFEDLDVSIMAWLCRKGKELVDNYVGFQAFNLGDWLRENWKITENAFGTNVDNKNLQITFQTHQIDGLTDLMDSLADEADLRPEDMHYTYEL